ncbi:hypothetical protein BDZ45DRAFT_798978 [Acephala macrosclerotiorum]|nr:hypothetical protein BDZ45DRAFT_798978 [Acephala macrosclerotiorum]
MQFSSILTLALAVTSTTAIDVYFTCPADYTGQCCLFQLCHDATKPANAIHKHEWACLNNVGFTANCCDPEVMMPFLKRRTARLLEAGGRVRGATSRDVVAGRIHREGIIANRLGRLMSFWLKIVGLEQNVLEIWVNIRGVQWLAAIRVTSTWPSRGLENVFQAAKTYRILRLLDLQD